MTSSPDGDAQDAPDLVRRLKQHLRELHPYYSTAPDDVVKEFEKTIATLITEYSSWKAQRFENPFDEGRWDPEDDGGSSRNADGETYADETGRRPYSNVIDYILAMMANSDTTGPSDFTVKSLWLRLIMRWAGTFSAIVYRHGRHEGRTSVYCHVADKQHQDRGGDLMLRIPLYQWHSDGRSLGKFFEETAIQWRRLDHPSLLPLNALKKVDGIYFFVTPYVEAQDDSRPTLLQHLRKQKAAAVPYVFDRAIQQIATLLVYLHRQRCYGTPWSPSKLLWTSKNTLQHVDPVALSSRLMDAVEENQSAAATAKDDILAVGRALYGLMVGETAPVSEEALKECPLGKYDRFFNLVSRLLGLDQTRQFQSAEEFLRAVEPSICELTCVRHDNKLTYDLQHGTDRRRFTAYAADTVIGDLLHDVGRIGTKLVQAAQGGPQSQRIKKEVTQEWDSLLKQSHSHILGEVLYADLLTREENILCFEHDSRLAGMPWELVLDKAGLRHALCRQSPASLPRRRKPHRILSRKLRILLLYDSDPKLKFSEVEADELKEEFDQSPLGGRITVDRLDVGKDLTFSLLNKSMQEADIIHFCGHAEFRLDDRGAAWQSGWYSHSKRRQVLVAAQVPQSWADAATVPWLVFSNACSACGPSEWLRRPPLHPHDSGMPEAFLAEGVANYIGTLWPILDSPSSVHFARLFYRSFLAGRPASLSMLDARKVTEANKKNADLTFAQYALYGDATARLPMEEILMARRDDYRQPRMN